ncbi:MAG: hypothetical protein LQ350_000561 [Teloschistes chrysophthalmus]|nr:MAG: hypothetical protein LQ350_000561 [Niorma chrysophthalma]
MTSQTGLSGLPAPDESNTRTSSVPLLGEGFSESNTRTVSDSTGSDREQDSANTQELDSKTGKRRFWGLGKKKDESKVKGKPEAAMASASNSTAVPEFGPPSISSLESPRRTKVASPSIPTSHPYGTPPDTGRKMSSGSPHIPSPASSQIFERSVQEDGLAASASPAIPSHITTENHIPPVLDASSAAITDDHLNPDKVEIVMHAAHQPAAVTVTGGSSVTDPTPSSQDEPLAYTENDDTASNYGALDAADVRRLSFISFADVVHAEHVADHASGRESMMPSGAASITPLGAKHRSPSPIRSPLSSLAYGTSPPVGEPASSSQNLDTSPHRGGRNLGSPFPGHSPPTGGELTIETMRQALRKTGSGDLSGARSQPISAVGGDDSAAEYSLK